MATSAKRGSAGEARLAPNKVIVQTRIGEIKGFVKDIIQSKRNANQILRIFELSEEDDELIILSCIRAMHKIFCTFLEHEDIQESMPKQDTASKADTLRVWLKERYDDSVKRLAEWMKHSNTAVKELALCTLMKFVEAEGKYPLQGIAKKAVPAFPLALFEKILSALLNGAEQGEALISRFQEYTEYDDVRYHYMKTLSRLLQSIETVDEGSDVEHRNSNLMAGLLILSLPDTTAKLANFLVAIPENARANISNPQLHRRLFSKVWLQFVKLKLSSAQYKKILISLPEKILPYMEDPLVLSDWLTSLYDEGGALSLMALNGLFVLMNKFNLEYPMFYNKLYNIMDSEIFSAKYKARFFHLLDIFLQSLLLPSYMIAAFIKKLSRMSLTAPPNGTLLIIELIVNLLVRHKVCRFLVHRDGIHDLHSDPYDPKETDIMKCRAVESSLWEIKSLQRHWLHRVAEQAKRIEQPMPHMESTLDSLLELTMDELIEQEIKRTKKEVANPCEISLNQEVSRGVFCWAQSVADLWTVQPLAVLQS